MNDGGKMHAGELAPACANCHNVLYGVPSYAGRYPYHPEDVRQDAGQPVDIAEW